MELKTKRLLLRPLRADDAPTFVSGLNNYSVSQFLARVPFPYTLEMAQDFIRTHDKAASIFAICFACAPDEILGVISYELNQNGEYALGYWLRECCWGLGIMSEAARAVVQHAFEFGQCAKLVSGYWNPISGRLLKRLGFVETGLANVYCVAQSREIAMMQLELRSDFKAKS